MPGLPVFWLFLGTALFVIAPVNKELVTRLIATKLRLTNPGDAEESYQAAVNFLERVPHPNLDGMRRLQRLLAQLNPKVAEVRVETLIDGSFIDKLESSGFIQSVYKKK